MLPDWVRLDRVDAVDTVGAYLFVAGDVAECPSEYTRLTAIAERLGIADRVVFGGRLAPHEAEVGGGSQRGYSVRDLLAHATVMSFLTSYDYESYGNPIGEAIASHVPYITTRYELYDTVYGDEGFRAPVLDITSDDLPTKDFVKDVADLLTNDERRSETAEFNYRLGQRHFTPGRGEELIDRLFSAPMGQRTKLSVVVPVFTPVVDRDGAG